MNPEKIKIKGFKKIVKISFLIILSFFIHFLGFYIFSHNLTNTKKISTNLTSNSPSIRVSIINNVTIIKKNISSMKTEKLPTIKPILNKKKRPQNQLTKNNQSTIKEHEQKPLINTNKSLNNI